MSSRVIPIPFQNALSVVVTTTAEIVPNACRRKCTLLSCVVFRARLVSVLHLRLALSVALDLNLALLLVLDVVLFHSRNSLSLSMFHLASDVDLISFLSRSLPLSLSPDVILILCSSCSLPLSLLMLFSLVLDVSSRFRSQSSSRLTLDVVLDVACSLHHRALILIMLSFSMSHAFFSIVHSFSNRFEVASRTNVLLHCCYSNTERWSSISHRFGLSLGRGSPRSDIASSHSSQLMFLFKHYIDQVTAQWSLNCLLVWSLLDRVVTPSSADDLGIDQTRSKLKHRCRFLLSVVFMAQSVSSHAQWSDMVIAVVTCLSSREDRDFDHCRRSPTRRHG